MSHRPYHDLKIGINWHEGNLKVLYRAVRLDAYAMHRLSLLRALASLFLVLQGVATQAQPLPNTTLGQERDRQALVALYYATQDGSFGESQMEGWELDGYPCSSPNPWAHITCSTEGRVTELDLSGLDIAGTLPVELRELSELKVLKLDNNRFMGPLPIEWGEPLFFSALEILSLASNQLNGSLPNRQWNLVDVWPSLRTLILRSNSFWGGLPDGWAGSERVFSQLEELDLSENFLGFADAGTTQLADQPEWCLPGDPPANAGWCAMEPLDGTFASLLLLDLSSNGLHGQLPESWPAMFPRLQTLRLFGNQLSVQLAAEAAPAALPKLWTAYKIPTSFPDLQDLVLWPGNVYICSVPDGEGGFLDINTDGTYLVSDEGGASYDASTPWHCPGPTQDNPPAITSLAVDEATATARLEWEPPGEGQAAYVFGYSVSLSRWALDYEDWESVPEWEVRFFRTFLDSSYPKLKQGLTQSSSSGRYTLKLEGYQGPSGRHRVAMASINMDGTPSNQNILEVVLKFPGQPEEQ